MAPDTITLLAGILFLFIAVVGGGFTVERLQVPAVPRWSRVVSGVLGVGFVAGFFYALGSDDTEPPPAAVPAAAATPDQPSAAGEADGTVELFRVPGPVTSEHGVEVTDFAATSTSSPPTAGDVATVRFTLRNATDRPIELGAFLAARNPADDNLDTETASARLEAGESVQSSADITLDQAGGWKFWPCYSLTDGDCPSEWQARVVTVGR